MYADILGSGPTLADVAVAIVAASVAMGAMVTVRVAERGLDATRRALQVATVLEVTVFATLILKAGLGLRRDTGGSGRLVRAPWLACLLATRANRQPALGMYFEDARAGVLRLVGLLVLTLEGARIAAITRFDHSVLDRFDLPQTLTL